MAMPSTSPLATVDYVITNNATVGDMSPWANKSDAQKFVEIIYLTVLAVTGTIGNLSVISSIALQKRIHSNGNVFVINLAVADLLITAFVVPTVIANVAFGDNALGTVGCFVAGYTVTVTCTCSLCNLMFIAINRYFAVVRSSSYKHTFTQRKVHIMVLGIWVWSNLVSFPTFLNWSRIQYDEKIELCSWDDTWAYSYTIFLTTVAILIPLVVIFFCYFKLFTTVRSSGRWVRGLSTLSGIPQNGEQKRRSMRKERNLLQTLATTVAFFCICWLPYGIAILVDAVNIEATTKKVFGWLGLTNSGINFFIYGFMNPVFRKGYRDLYALIFGCKARSRTDSNVNQGTIHSDSMYRSGTRKRSVQSNGTPLSIPRGLNAITTNNSNGNLKQIIVSRSIKVWSTNVKMWYPPYKTNSGIFTHNGSPQCTRTPIKAGLTLEVTNNASEQENSSIDNQVKLQPAISESLSAWRRPSSFFKRERKASANKKENDKETKQLARSSLMLLQIQLADDVEPGSEPRRTKSEGRNGTRYPEKKRSSSVGDATISKASKEEKKDSKDNIDNKQRDSVSTITDAESISSNSESNRDLSGKLGLIHEKSEANNVALAQNLSDS